MRIDLICQTHKGTKLTAGIKYRSWSQGIKIKVLREITLHLEFLKKFLKKFYLKVVREKKLETFDFYNFKLHCAIAETKKGNCENIQETNQKKNLAMQKYLPHP